MHQRERHRIESPRRVTAPPPRLTDRTATALSSCEPQSSTQSAPPPHRRPPTSDHRYASVRRASSRRRQLSAVTAVSSSVVTPTARGRLAFFKYPLPALRGALLNQYKYTWHRASISTGKSHHRPGGFSGVGRSERGCRASERGQDETPELHTEAIRGEGGAREPPGGLS